MKKVLLFICLLFTVTCIYSQEHLVFKDIPIDGKLNKFVRELKKQGYKQVEGETNKTLCMVKGNFVGDKVLITAYGTAESKTVWKVMVNFYELDNWDILKKKYFELKDLYTTKYGEPHTVIEKFRFASLEGSGKELEAFAIDDAIYTSFFDAPNGFIRIEIESLESFGYVLVTYEDEINGDLFDKEHKDSKLNDI